MEVYFVIQATKEKGFNVYATLVTVKTDLNEAKSLFHQILASVYANENIEHAVVTLQDYMGEPIIKTEAIVPDI